MSTYYFLKWTDSLKVRYIGIFEHIYFEFDVTFQKFKMVDPNVDQTFLKSGKFDEKSHLGVFLRSSN